MPEPEYRRLRLYFTKRGDSRFLSHLDLMRTIERAVRRAGLPVRFTEGENPHVRLSFPAALPLGLESLCEALEVQVLATVTVREACARLSAELPETLRFFGGDAAFPGEKWRLAENLYEVRPGDGVLPDAAELEALSARAEIPVERRGKTVDLKPLLRSVERHGDRLLAGIAWSEEGTARPEDLLRALNRDPGAFRVVKIGMVFTSNRGETLRKVHDPSDPG